MFSYSDIFASALCVTTVSFRDDINSCVTKEDAHLQGKEQM